MVPARVAVRRAALRGAADRLDPRRGRRARQARPRLDAPARPAPLPAPAGPRVRPPAAAAIAAAGIPRAPGLGTASPPCSPSAARPAPGRPAPAAAGRDRGRGRRRTRCHRRRATRSGAALQRRQRDPRQGADEFTAANEFPGYHAARAARAGPRRSSTSSGGPRARQAAAGEPAPRAARRPAQQPAHRERPHPGIGAGRAATLAAYGITTAADVSTPHHHRSLASGQAWPHRLAGWRQSLENAFVFDPSKPVGLPQGRPARQGDRRRAGRALRELRGHARTGWRRRCATSRPSRGSRGAPARRAAAPRPSPRRPCRRHRQARAEQLTKKQKAPSAHPALCSAASVAGCKPSCGWVRAWRGR